LNPEDGKTMWEFKVYQGSLNNGLMATGGGLVFVLTREGNFFALDARTGKHLWHFLTGANPAAAPMSYAVDGRQYIAVSAGNAVFSFALSEEGARPTN
jgi:alcohol dehydrogenase (cytochrome c)